MEQKATRQEFSARAALVACAALLAVFAALSWTAVRGKCATYDETVHAPAAYTELRYHDYRVNPEHPPLWKYWAALPWLIWPPGEVNVSGPEFASILEHGANKWDWAQRTMFATPGNDPEGLLARSRAMMLVWGVGLGALLAWWSYRIAGPVAAVVTCGLYSLDPNFLAHGSLLTNDVAYTFVLGGVCYATWRVGRRASVGRVIGLAGSCALAVATKHTGILLAPIVACLLAIRALAPEPWQVAALGMLVTRGRRLAGAAAIWAVCALVAYAGIWAAYGFRTGVTPDPDQHFDLDAKVRGAVAAHLMGQTGRPATDREVAAAPTPALVGVAVWAYRHHVVPEPFAYGLLTVYSTSEYHWSYLLGEVSGVGHWYYFPVAMAVKTPLATWAAVVAAVVVLAGRRRWGGDGWAWACLLVPAGVILAAAMSSHLNIGLRHVFPVYVPAFVAAGVAAGRSSRRWPRATVVGAGVVLVGLAVESLAAYPNYIPFFNAAAGGSRGGLRILSDSNLDWGQDLPLVAKWQWAHPDRTLYLAYFGTALPEYYKIRYLPLTRGNDTRVSRREFPTKGVVAVSARFLQDTWPRPEARAFFSDLRGRRPTDVLGGSIYVYDLGGQ